MKHDKNLTKWLYSKELNIFATVTLKKRIWTANSKGEYYLEPITKEHIQKTGWMLRDRVSKVLFGTRAFKNKKIPPFLVFTENDSDNRPHLHILASKPAGMASEECDNLFRTTAQNLDWVYDQIDIRPICPSDITKVILYSLKTGFDAFIPQASFIPSNS